MGESFYIYTVQYYRAMKIDEQLLHMDASYYYTNKWKKPDTKACLLYEVGGDIVHGRGHEMSFEASGYILYLDLGGGYISVFTSWKWFVHFSAYIYVYVMLQEKKGKANKIPT